MDLLAFVLALQAEGKTSEEIRAAVNQYIEDNPSALDQAAVEAILDGRLDDIVLAQQNQPTSEDNRIWFPTAEGETIQVPTYEEYSELKSALSDIQTATANDVGKALSPKTVTNGTVTEWQYKVIGGGGGGGAVDDVKINGTSIVDGEGVANIPKAVASSGVLGVVQVVGANFGIGINSDGALSVSCAQTSTLKSDGGNAYKPIASGDMQEAAFYGLAYVAGDTTQKNSSNAVGTYTENAKSAIQTMLSAPETVSGTTPTIAAKAGVQYICGECATLDITLPASGCIDVVFQSGSTATVLTVTPPTGVTVKWANGFDPTALEADTTYEINIKDGLGVAVAWT